MKVDFNSKIKTLRGEVIKNAYGENDMLDSLQKYGVPNEKLLGALAALAPFAHTGEKQTEDLCAHHLAVNALQFIGQDEKVDGSKKIVWTKLAFRIMDVQPITIDETEKKLILERVERAYPQSVLFYARLDELFKQAEAEELAEKTKKDEIPTT